MTQNVLDSPKRDEGEADDLFYLSAGPLAAILLGMCLVPLRGFTVASNFTFVFVVLTIVVAEFGGRRAALATAVTSTLSLDFFLTEPYLKLTISSKHDVIAFCGLAICGVLVATLSSRRARNQQALRTARAHLDLLHAGVREMDEASAAKPGVEGLVDALRRVALLSAVAVRDEKGRLLASSGDGAARTTPHETLRPEELLVVLPGPLRILPPEGNRISLKVGTRPVGSLDVWGTGPPLSVDAGRLLSDLAILLGLLLGHQAAESH
jgi:K+-sensing histidine kinase KdpD